MTLRRALSIAFAAAFSLMWGVCAYTYSILPDRFPMHFDGAGTPDRFADKSIGQWAALPLVFTVLTGLFLAMAIFIPKLGSKYPKWINVPEKAAFMRLSEDARAKALAPMSDLSLMMGPALHLLSAYIQWGSAKVARQEVATLSPMPIAFVLIYSFATLFTAVVRMRDSVRSAG